ncbi:hypothetical protein NCAS_0A06800 [Naumovozyma castellii]|uniref:FCP1 homology domain-containing protein n=1 Tax=Naumovozyma castellii TaxID=27288 RepID=G0V6Z0_NAUCA|nr:hypothetical protein NCAS_0A06800 [Naumovozyma castellii CBS 4309]CCC67238.1 hypothetical protein NCAS_0A06800 [Naumovozyma castellii CBS 4309]
MGFISSVLCCGNEDDEPITRYQTNPEPKSKDISDINSSRTHKQRSRHQHQHRQQPRHRSRHSRSPQRYEKQKEDELKKGDIESVNLKNGKKSESTSTTSDTSGNTLDSSSRERSKKKEKQSESSPPKPIERKDNDVATTTTSDDEKGCELVDEAEADSDELPTAGSESKARESANEERETDHQNINRRDNVSSRSAAQRASQNVAHEQEQNDVGYIQDQNTSDPNIITQTSSHPDSNIDLTRNYSAETATTSMATTMTTTTYDDEDEEDEFIDLTLLQPMQYHAPGFNTLLPPKTEKKLIGKKCLVLDLDETLVHSSFKYLQTADFVLPVNIDEQIHNVYVIKRPGVEEFLKRVGELFEVVVFTASVARYGDPLLDILDPGRQLIHHRLFREACYNYEGNYIKNLSQMGRPLSEIIILDNSPASYIFHPQHAIPISSWFSDSHDNELLDIIPLLEDLANIKSLDVGKILDVTI